MCRPISSRTPHSYTVSTCVGLYQVELHIAVLWVHVAELSRLHITLSQWSVTSWRYIKCTHSSTQNREYTHNTSIRHVIDYGYTFCLKSGCVQHLPGGSGQQWTVVMTADTSIATKTVRSDWHHAVAGETRRSMRGRADQYWPALLPTGQHFGNTYSGWTPLEWPLAPEPLERHRLGHYGSCGRAGMHAPPATTTARSLSLVVSHLRRQSRATHVHMYTHTHVHAYTRTHVHAHTRTRVHAYTRTRAHAHTRTRVHAYTRTRVHAYTRTRVHAYTPTHLHTYTPTHLHTYTPTHLHTYTPTHLHMYKLTTRCMGRTDQTRDITDQTRDRTDQTRDTTDQTRDTTDQTRDTTDQHIETCNGSTYWRNSLIRF